MLTTWMSGPANPQAVLWILPVFWWLRLAKLLQLFGAFAAIYGVLSAQSKLRLASRLRAAAEEAPRLKAPRDTPLSTAFWWGAAALVATVAILAVRYQDLSSPALAAYMFLGMVFGMFFGLARWFVGQSVWTIRFTAFLVRKFGVPVAAKLFSAEMGDRSAVAIGVALVAIGMLIDLAMS